MVKDIQAIDFSNEMEILYIYKNIKELPDILRQFQKIKFNDLSFSLFCYGIVEKAVLEELQEFFIDHEMEELVRTMLGNENGGEGCRGDGLASSSKSAVKDGRFYISHLHILLKPLVNVCNKQIVDLVYYVFKKAGVNHFEFLFDVFTSESQLIELHLLVAKGMRDRSFDLSDMKECLEHKESFNAEAGGSVASSDLAQPNAPDPAPPSNPDSNTVSLGSLSPPLDTVIPLPFVEKPKDLQIDVGCFSNDNSSDEELDHVKNLSAKPFKEKSVMNPAFHLQKAKALLLTYKGNDASFFIENVTTYLSMKFDRELFIEYLSYRCYTPFSINLKKLPHAPFFFYANTSITRILAPATKVVKRDPYDFSMQEGSCSIPINSYILKYFLEFCHTTFFDINSPLSDYILISKSLRYFVEFYRDPAFFKVMYELLNCKISKIEADIKSNLLSDLSLYVDVFYNSSRTTLDNSDDELDHWTLKFYPPHKKVDQNPYGDGTTIRENKKPSSIPSIGEDSKSALTSAYVNSSFYDDVEKKISRHLLDLFSENYNEDQVDVDEFLESFVLEISSSPHLKIYVLRSIEQIHSKFSSCAITHEKQAAGSSKGEDSVEDVKTKPCEPCFDKVLDNLKDFPKLNWRYKKVFLNKLDDLEKLGIDRTWIKETLKSDRVFYIKNMVGNLK